MPIVPCGHRADASHVGDTSVHSRRHGRAASSAPAALDLGRRGRADGVLDQVAQRSGRSPVRGVERVARAASAWPTSRTVCRRAASSTRESAREPRGRVGRGSRRRRALVASRRLRRRPCAVRRRASRRRTTRSRISFSSGTTTVGHVAAVEREPERLLRARQLRRRRDARSSTPASTVAERARLLRRPSGVSPSPGTAREADRRRGFEPASRAARGRASARLRRGATAVVEHVLASRSSRRARIAGAFSARTNRQTRRHALEQQPAEVAQPALRVAAPRARAGRPRPAGAGPPSGVHAEASALKRIDAVLDPEPRAALLDLRRACASGSRPGRAAADRARAPRSCAAAHAGTSSSRSSSVAARSPVPPGVRRLVEHVDGLARPVLARPRQRAVRRVPELATPRPASPIIMRGAARAASPRERAAALARTGTTFAPRWQSARSSPVLGERDEAAEPAPRDVLEEDALDGILRAEGEDLLAPGLDELGRQVRNSRRRFRTSLAQALENSLGFRRCRSTFEPSPATTPRRASSPATRCGPSTSPRRSSRTPSQRNGERGMLGYTGTWQGKPVSVQATRHGLPVGRDRDRGARSSSASSSSCASAPAAGSSPTTRSAT